MSHTYNHYMRRTRGRGSSIDMNPHSSHGGQQMAQPMMQMPRSLNPLPGFHPLTTRTNIANPYASTSMFPAGYPAGNKGPPQGMPQTMMQQQSQVPLHPDVTLKRIPFYEVEGECLRPSTLLHNPGAREPGHTFSFILSPTLADLIAINREISPGKNPEYLYQVQMRFCVSESSCEQEDSFPPGVAVKINGKPCALPSGPVAMNKSPAEVKRPPRPVNISSLCKLCPAVSNTVHVTWTPDYSRGSLYVVGIWVVKKLTALDLLDKLKAKGARQREATASIIKEKLTEDGDGDIATTSLRVSLICPLGKMRITTPIRPVTCTHLQCFDATIYLQMNEKKPTWMCPVCNKPGLYDNLVIDGYFQDVLESQRLPQDCHEIQLNKDGSWDAHDPSVKKKAAGILKTNESVQEINDLDSDDSMDTGMGGSDGGAGVKQDDGETAKTNGNAVVMVDLTSTDSESEDNGGTANQPAAPRTDSTNSTTNGPPAKRLPDYNDPPAIIMLDSPSPPPREPSPVAPSPAVAAAPRYEPLHIPPIAGTPPLAGPPPPWSQVQRPSSSTNPQVHPPLQTAPYTSYMGYDSYYHPH